MLSLSCLSFLLLVAFRLSPLGRTMPDQITVSEFIAETTEDYNSPTTSSFTTRLLNCRNTITLLEEVQYMDVCPLRLGCGCCLASFVIVTCVLWAIRGYRAPAPIWKAGRQASLRALPAISCYLFGIHGDTRGNRGKIVCPYNYAEEIVVWNEWSLVYLWHRWNSK